MVSGSGPGPDLGGSSGGSSRNGGGSGDNSNAGGGSKRRLSAPALALYQRYPTQLAGATWLAVLAWSLLIFYGSGGMAPDEPISKPVAQPLLEPIIEPINEARGEPLPGPGYDKLDHAAEYGVLGLLLMAAYTLTARLEGAPGWLAAMEEGWPGQRAWRLWKIVTPLLVLTLLTTSIYGATDELHQATNPARTADWRDWLADTLGGLAGGLVFLLGRNLAARFKP